MKKNLERDIELLFEIGSLRYVDRAWKQFYNSDIANNSEHSFRVAWLALTLAKIEGVKNHEKILKMALMHDLPESRCGDANYLQRQYIKRDEKRALKDMLKDTIHSSEMIALFDEYEDRKTIEAKIVKDADILDSNLEIMEQKWFGSRVGDNWVKRKNELLYPKLSTKSAGELWKGIFKTNPHNWHLLSPQNRFRGGDWKRHNK